MYFILAFHSAMDSDSAPNWRSQGESYHEPQQQRSMPEADHKDRRGLALKSALFFQLLLKILNSQEEKHHT